MLRDKLIELGKQTEVLTAAEKVVKDLETKLKMENFQAYKAFAEAKERVKALEEDARSEIVSVFNEQGPDGVKDAEFASVQLRQTAPFEDDKLPIVLFLMDYAPDSIEIKSTPALTALKKYIKVDAEGEPLDTDEGVPVVDPETGVVVTHLIYKPTPVIKAKELSGYVRFALPHEGKTDGE